jgi:hypothetical protein
LIAWLRRRRGRGRRSSRVLADEVLGDFKCAGLGRREGKQACCIWCVTGRGCNVKEKRVVS